MVLMNLTLIVIYSLKLAEYIKYDEYFEKSDQNNLKSLE